MSTETRCPHCNTPLTQATRCAACGRDVSAPIVGAPAPGRGSGVLIAVIVGLVGVLALCLAVGFVFVGFGPLSQLAADVDDPSVPVPVQAPKPPPRK